MCLCVCVCVCVCVCDWLLCHGLRAQLAIAMGMNSTLNSCLSQGH